MELLITLLLVASGTAAVLGVLLFRARKNVRLLERNLTIERELDEITRNRAAVDGFYDNVLEADITNDCLVGQNAAALSHLLGLSADAPFSNCIEEVIAQFVKAEYRELYRKSFDRQTLLQRFETGDRKFTFEFEERADLKNYCWTRVTVCIYYSEASQAVKIISYVKNIQDEKARELHLLKEANTDYLTGLYNKRAAEAMIYPILQSTQTQAPVHGLMMVDVDHFKQINDTFGHSCGDEVLCQIALLLRQQMDLEDIISRIGGDEFLVLLRNCSTPESAAHRVQRFQDALSATQFPQYPTIQITTSIGLALYPNDADHYIDLFNMADQALYATKRAGRNGFRFYSDLRQASTDP